MISAPFPNSTQKVSKTKSTSDVTYSAPIDALARLAAIFTPSAPVHAVSQFRGRAAQVQMLLETVSQVGQHAIVYGEAGVGKTSFAKVLYQIADKLTAANLKFAHINCDVEDTFDSLWKKVFRELSVSWTGKVTAGKHKSLVEPRTLANWLADEVSPEDIRRLAILADARLIIIIDEFDQLPENSETVRLVANTIKTLSDHRAPVTLILVGVADTVNQLIAEHKSIERNLVQVHMPRMKDGEIAQILQQGLASLEIALDYDEVAYVCSVAQGLPSIAHRIGLQLAYRMLETRNHHVGRRDVDNALQDVIDRMPQSHLKDWMEATDNSRGEGLFEQSLLAAALASKNEQGWFQMSDVLEPFRALTDNYQYGAGAYSQHLHRFVTSRGLIMDRVRVAGRWHFRFKNPSFQSYAMMRGLMSGRITEATLARFKRNLPS